MSDDEQIPDTWITRTELNKLLGMSRKAIDLWQIKPVGKKGKNVFYTIQDVIENRLEHAKRKTSHVTNLEDGAVEFERYRLLKAQADSQELKNKKEEAELVPAELLTFVINGVAVELASTMDSLILNMIRKTPDLTILQQETLKRELAKGMRSMSNIDEKISEVLDDYVRSLQ